jgi:hypothetical protein
VLPGQLSPAGWSRTTWAQLLYVLDVRNSPDDRRERHSALGDAAGRGLGRAGDRGERDTPPDGPDSWRFVSALGPGRLGRAATVCRIVASVRVRGRVASPGRLLWAPPQRAPAICYAGTTAGGPDIRCGWRRRRPSCS